MAPSFHPLAQDDEERAIIDMLPNPHVDHEMHWNHTHPPQQEGGCRIFVSVCVLIVLLILSVGYLSFVVMYPEKIPLLSSSREGTLGALIAVALLALAGLTLLFCVPPGRSSSTCSCATFCGVLLDYQSMSICCFQMVQCCMLLPQMFSS